METGKNITSSTMESSLDGKLLSDVDFEAFRCGFFEAVHRTSPVAPDAGVAKSTWTWRTKKGPKLGI